MRILVTGATGRVGSRLVPRLLARGDSVRLLVRNPERAEVFRQQGAELVVGDLLDVGNTQQNPQQEGVLAQAVEGVDAVIHLAAFFRGATPEETQAVNLGGTVALAEAALRAGNAHFIFISTNLVYGPGLGRAAREDDVPKPTVAYPISKVAAEEVLLGLQRTQGLRLSIVRLPFVYGEGDPHLAEGMTWFRTWHPQQRFQMAHHADVAQALMLVVDNPKSVGQIYNVAEDEAATVAELMQIQGEPLTQDTTGSDTVDSPVQPVDSLTNSMIVLVESEKIRQQLGFRPRYANVHAAVAAGVM